MSFLDSTGVAYLWEHFLARLGDAQSELQNKIHDEFTSMTDVEVDALCLGMPDNWEYLLTEDRTFDGVDDYIDTGVKLFDTEKDWTIFVSFTGADWVNNATVFSAQTPGWASGLSLYSYVSDSGHLYSLGGGGKDIGGTAGLNGFTYNPDTGSNPWLDMDDNDPTAWRYNIVLRWSAQTDRFYYATSANGVNKQSGSFTVPYRQHMLPVMLGAEHLNSSGGQQRFWHGTIHKAGVWLRPITDEETASLLALE